MKDRGSSRVKWIRSTTWWCLGILGAGTGTLAIVAAVLERSTDERGTVLLVGYGVLGFTLFAVAVSVVLKRANRLADQAPSSLGAHRNTLVVAAVGLLLFALLVARALAFGSAPAQ